MGNTIRLLLLWIYLFLAPHLPLFLYHILQLEDTGIPKSLWILCFIVFQLYTTIRLHICKLRPNESGNVRIGILYGGRKLIHTGLIGLYLLPVWYLVCAFLLPVKLYDLPRFGFPYALQIAEVIYAFLFVFLFLVNGALRIFFTSRNLGITKRLLIVLFMWVPFVQLCLAHIMCRAAKDEYLIAAARKNQTAFSVCDNTCQTNYPLIMVHGIGFRDLRYFNYWGRIPSILRKHGAKVYYGHQNAWGTIEENAVAIAAVINLALKENNCDKVNIIAHSKGGLDSRYLISSMKYDKKVASLTTICTPHYGSELINFLNHLPDACYRFVASCINRPFALAGDKQPDCYSSSKQLSPDFCKQFNETNKDCPGVYYQSYASVMKSCFSDSLLSIPYLLMRLLGAGANDGLVNVASAQWGNFKGVLKNKYRRGISHGDMIDLKREDIKGFDVLNVFYEIVVSLKKAGF